MNRKASQEKRYDAMNVLNNVFLFSKDISSKYDNADNVLQGSSIDKKYLDFLSSGEYYEKYKPGIQKTTGFNFGTSLSRFFMSTLKKKGCKSYFFLDYYPSQYPLKNLIYLQEMKILSNMIDMV
jgi:hypothetical protein